MKILLAKNAGFCFGVRRAVDMAREAVAKLREQDASAVVYTYGELIHNMSVVEELRSSGIIPIDELNGLKKGDTVVIRSHGVPAQVYSYLDDLGVNIVDATCPFVESIHKIVSEAYKKGEQVFIVGDSVHPETIGINGYCGNTAVFIENEEALRLLENKSGCLVVQTTFDSTVFSDYERIIKEKYP